METTHNGLDARSRPIRIHTVGAANAPCTATMPAVPGRVNVFTGYDYTGTGATAGATVDIAVSGLFTRKMAVPAGATLLASDSVRPPHGLAASGANVGITVSVPALGVGNLGGHLIVYGYSIPG